MPKVVCLDSQIFIWGVKKNSHPSQSGKIPVAEKLISELENKEIKILIPVPIIAELLSHINSENEKNVILDLLNNKNFIIKPFDKLAALKCSELLFRTFTTKEIVEYTKQHSVFKAKIKYDAMIAAIAIVNKCDCIYSEDEDISRYSHGQIAVKTMPSYPIQKNLFDSII